uniref:SGS domain-containing protein n=1 Tax=Rhinopithecus roxellana TaxID=61622 RepID=A0A2K6R2M0_RHIRO
MAAAAAGPATSQRFFQSCLDAVIDEDPQAVLELLAKALEQKPDDAQYSCQRGYCHILLRNYCVAVADAKKSVELNPNNSTAMLRKGICEYYEKNYAAALEIFTEGQKLVVWIKRCQEAQNGSESEVWTHQSKIKCDWYQSQVVITLMIKNVQKNDVNVDFSERDHNLKLELHPIIPEQSTLKVVSTKIEIKLKKPEAVRWEKLEGQGDVPITYLYPSSSPYTRNWDKLVGEIKEEEKNEKLEGNAALNVISSGGIVLSANWSDVGEKEVEINPPDDKEWKKC